MEDLVLTIPTQDLGIMETLANRMGWTVRSKRSIVQKFVDSCPKTPMMTDEEIAAEVNAVRYKKSCKSPDCFYNPLKTCLYGAKKVYLGKFIDRSQSCLMCADA